jgi:hypothetical protein
MINIFTFYTSVNFERYFTYLSHRTVLYVFEVIVTFQSDCVYRTFTIGITC